jgi:hypothetical protein
MRMRGLRFFAVSLSLAWLTWTATRAQSPLARVDTVAGVHAASFATPRGVIRVFVPSDASPGDTISGRIVAEPAGQTLQDRDASLTDLNGWAVEWQGQRVPVSAGRYEWSIPLDLRTGAGELVLRDRDGRAVGRASVPVDPVPAVPRAPAAEGALDIPSDLEIGSTAVIRGQSDGKLGGKTITFAAVEADVLAISPRQLAYRVPAMPPGSVSARFAFNESVAERTLRVVDVRVSASMTQLLRDQRATLTITVRGLAGITEPVSLSVVNQSPATVRIDDVERPIMIKPSQVRRDGTLTVTRRLTGIQPGAFQISAHVGRPPTAQFDVRRSTARVLTDWQVRTGVGISAGAGELVQRSVSEAKMDEFLGGQQAYGGDAQDVFAALLSHYCFDLRDDGLSRRRADGMTGPGIRLVAFAQGRPAAATITESEVERLSFSDFLSKLTERFRMRQAVGYLFVRSRAPRVPITLDREKKGDLTDRRFVTSAGEHDVVVASAQACRQRVTVNPFQTAVVDCGT